MHLNYFYFIFLLLASVQMFYFQIYKLNIDNTDSCLKSFKSNSSLGLLILLALAIGKF